jgi:uracil-DNA glycosylase
MDVKIEKSWKSKLKGEFEKEYFKDLTTFVKSEYQEKKIYPPAGMIFNAFNLCPYKKVKVVIIGQDPYHGVKQANGLSFSVNPDIQIPPSLQNIYKEIKNDLGIDSPKNGDLTRWAEQGVLLLNATLTVQASTPGSHQRKGWEQFTDAVIKILSEDKEHLVFILWGKYAQDKGQVIDKSKHLVIQSPHPSPFSADRGFFGSKPFSKANAYLKEHNLKEINW